MKIAEQAEFAADKQIARIHDDQDEYDKMVEHLLSGEYDPTAHDNILEALGEFKPAQLTEIAEYIDTRDHLELGRMVAIHIDTYWTQRAEEDAPQIIAERKNQASEAYADSYKEEAF